jgi:flagellar hook-associated protein 1 FlgK
LRSTFMGLETAKRSLFAQQTAMQTTGHNIANANTAGYTRQVVNMTAAKPMEAMGMTHTTAPGQLGQGVEVTSITRIREKFLDDQFTTENKLLGEWEIRSDTLEKLEAIINEPSDNGIRQVIEGFWNAWQELSKTPENMTARVLVKERALALTDAFNHTGRQLRELSEDITSNIGVKVNQINSLAKQITSLNGEIVRVEGLGDSANDLRDQRDLLVDNLSKIVNIKVTGESAGYRVQMGNVVLAAPNEEPAALTSNDMTQAKVSGDLLSGEVFGMIHSRDVHIANYRYQLDLMVKGIAEGNMKVTLPAGSVIPDGTTLTSGTTSTTFSGSVANRTLANDMTVVVKGLNGLHALGYSSNNASPPVSNIPLFTQKVAGTWSAETFSVNADILADVTNIASSMRTYEDAAGKELLVKGNNSMALLIASARDQKLDFDALTGSSSSNLSVLSGGTFSEFFQSIVGELGVQSQEASRQVSNQQVLVEQVDSRRQSVSGVSLDEEMANLIKYQHSYNAAARVMTTVDEMLDKIINGMGVVGR